MKKLISCSAIVSVELKISDGAPTMGDIVRLLNSGEYSLEVYEPFGDELSIVIREE